MNIFVYGSLMYDEVWSRVVKGVYDKHRALLNGWQRFAIKGKDYPAAVTGQGYIEGIVCLNITEYDLQRLDKFEGYEYKRQTCTVVAEKGRKINAFVYKFRDEYSHLLCSYDWDADRFETVGLKQFLNNYYGFDNIGDGI